ncbi:MAG: hypothetical protein V3T19_12140 [Acidiferrobacterales bacterium]|jgi:hypothetical protein
MGNKLLYPAVGIGAFFVLFMLGTVVAYDLGFSGGFITLTGIASGSAGAHLIVEHERRDADP